MRIFSCPNCGGMLEVNHSNPNKKAWVTCPCCSYKCQIKDLVDEDDSADRSFADFIRYGSVEDLVDFFVNGTLDSFKRISNDRPSVELEYSPKTTFKAIKGGRTSFLPPLRSQAKLELIE